jgi:uncharacterized membrane protein YebE (DUF533 family)
MFDAKDLLDVLVRGAQGQPQPPGRAQAPQGGGLGDILGELAKQFGQTGPQQGGSPGGGGGLADILGKVMPQLPGAISGAPPQQSQQSQTTGAGGGLADILSELQKQLGQGTQARQPHAAPSGQQSPGQPGSDGGLIDILGQILGQATSGVKEGAGRLDQATGASGQAGDALRKLTGKSPDELIAQVQAWIKANPGLAAAGAGGLGAIVLGTPAGRSLAVGALKLGALALIGGLAYKAYQNYSEGRPLISGEDKQALLAEAAPDGSGFEPDAVTNDGATLYIRAMIAAAAADGRLDDAEQQKILGGLQQAGLEPEAQAFLEQELQSPATAEALAAAVTSPAEAVQVFTAARLAIDLDTAEEHDFLVALANRLGIDPALAQHVDATARAAA